MDPRERRWTVDGSLSEGDRELVAVLLGRERTTLRCGGVAFEFAVDAGRRSQGGLIEEVRLSVRETTAGEPGGDGMAAGVIALETVLRPRIQAASIARLGPLDLPALRAAARKLLQAAADQVAARG